MGAAVAFADLGDCRATSFRNVNGVDDDQFYLDPEISPEHCFEEIVGNSPALRKVLEHVAIVAPTDSTVLLHGETGTGKDFVARAIHNLSSRRDRPYVRMNCAAIPSGLLESELFGHERGAFTGAVMQRKGQECQSKRQRTCFPEGRFSCTSYAERRREYSLHQHSPSRGTDLSIPIGDFAIRM